VISDNIYGTVGVLLNLPTAKTIHLPLSVGRSEDEDDDRTIPLLQKYGGSYVVFGEGERPLLWLHCNNQLRSARIGIPLDNDDSPKGNYGGIIWECTLEDVAYAIRHKIGSSQDFMVISGGFIWEKSDDGTTGGIREQVLNGSFEIVPSNCKQQVWDTLLGQEIMTTQNIHTNIKIRFSAWDVASNNDAPKDKDPFVFGTNITVANLADKALHKWAAKYILNESDCLT